MDRLNLNLPRRTADGVCILTQGQDHWGIAYMTYVLAKQANLTLDFSYCEQELPDSPLYLLPSVTNLTMSKYSYDRLKQRVAQGATLYLSMDDGFLTEFEELTGLRVVLARNAEDGGSLCLPDCRIRWFPRRCESPASCTPAKAPRKTPADTGVLPRRG